MSLIFHIPSLFLRLCGEPCSSSANAPAMLSRTRTHFFLEFPGACVSRVCWSTSNLAGACFGDFSFGLASLGDRLIGVVLSFNLLTGDICCCWDLCVVGDDLSLLSVICCLCFVADEFVRSIVNSIRRSGYSLFKTCSGCFGKSRWSSPY